MISELLHANIITIKAKFSKACLYMELMNARWNGIHGHNRTLQAPPHKKCELRTMLNYVDIYSDDMGYLAMQDLRTAHQVEQMASFDS